MYQSLYSPVWSRKCKLNYFKKLNLIDQLYSEDVIDLAKDILLISLQMVHFIEVYGDFMFINFDLAPGCNYIHDPLVISPFYAVLRWLFPWADSSESLYAT